MTTFLTVELALRLHARSIERYGGMSGVRDAGALASAIAQPEASFGGDLLHATIHEQAAAYLFHVAKNHPFFDGNKRTALACTAVFLEMNGVPLAAEHNDALEALTLAVAGGDCGKPRVAEVLLELSRHVP